MAATKTAGSGGVLGRLLSDAPRRKAWADPPLMLCTLTAKPFDDPRWIFEPKLDGLRILAIVDKGRGPKMSCTLMSRNDKAQTARFPEILEALKRAARVPCILDGEIVCLDESGSSSFRKLQQRFHIDDPEEIRRRMAEYPAVLYLFDILHCAGRDVTGLTLHQRKKILRAAVRFGQTIRQTTYTPETGVSMLADACQRLQEGIVAKCLDSTYQDGRSEDWLKIKCSGRQEFVIGGFTDPQRTRVGLGALLVGYYDRKDLVYCGKVGTGYTKDVLLDLRKRLDRLEIGKPCFTKGDPPTHEHVHFVRPRLVAEIAFAEWTQNQMLRQPRFEGLREDKAPKDVRREIPR